MVCRQEGLVLPHRGLRLLPPGAPADHDDGHPHTKAAASVDEDDHDNCDDDSDDHGYGDDDVNGAANNNDGGIV